MKSFSEHSATREELSELEVRLTKKVDNLEMFVALLFITNFATLVAIIGPYLI